MSIKFQSVSVFSGPERYSPFPGISDDPDRNLFDVDRRTGLGPSFHFGVITHLAVVVVVAIVVVAVVILVVDVVDVVVVVDIVDVVVVVVVFVVILVVAVVDIVNVVAISKIWNKFCLHLPPAYERTSQL